MTFRDRFHSGSPIWGPFFRTCSSGLAEEFATIGFDFVCVDMEHSALDRAGVDQLLLAFRAAQTDVIVRPPTGASEHIQAVLDMGASGVMVPHVNTAEDAAAVVSAATYGQARGFSGSIRATDYGALSMAEQIARGNAQRIVIAQIEDAEALDHVDEIAGVDGLDSIFIGRSDLTVSMGHTDRDAGEVIEAVEMVARKGVEAGKIVGTFTTNLDELPKWRALGVSYFILGSESGFMKAGARAFDQRVREGLS